MAPSTSTAQIDKNDAPEQLSLKEHYQNRIAQTEGRVGSLTASQVAKLRELWTLLLAEFETNQRIPVRYSLTQPASSGPDYETTDITALSFEPVETLSTNDKKPDEQQPAADSAQEKSSGSWLFRWASRSKPATPADSEAMSIAENTPHAESAPATPPSPAEDEEEEGDEQTRQRRHETVQAYLDRTQPASNAIIPAEFKPLFGERLGERTFRSAFWQAATQIGNPDAWVLRFLRARDWDVGEALQMVRRTLVWRTGQAIDEVAYYGESKLHYHTMESGLAFACTQDNLDNPVYVVRVRVNFARNRNIVAIKRFLCWQIETSQLLGDGRITILFDLTGFSRENIDLPLVRTLIALLTNYYPETLGILILHVNSWVFSGIWALISPFIDPAVKAKIVMAKNAKDIAPFIDSSRLIAEVGGEKRFVYEYVVPSARENQCMADSDARLATESAFVSAVDAYEAATRKWLSESSDAAEHARCMARDSLSQAVVALDPYIRSRTLYHRLGFINADHSVAF
ncbi:phosphatidylinositol transfer protein csr1 [Coemansia sp. RSA 2559]|nr:phosphatidylinositol transfer protein csr1 [Coemansia sp. RSA 2559]